MVVEEVLDETPPEVPQQRANEMQEELRLMVPPIVDEEEEPLVRLVRAATVEGEVVGLRRLVQFLQRHSSLAAVRARGVGRQGTAGPPGGGRFVGEGP